MCGPFFVLPPLQGEGGREATGWGSAKRGAGGAGLAFPTRARLRLAVPPPEGEGERYGMTLRRLRSRRSGRVRGGRASPGAYGFYRFDEADLPRAAVFHAPSGWRPLLRALPDHPPQTLLPATREGHGVASSPLLRRAASKRKAIHRPPRGPPGYPSPGLQRSTTARRHRGAGSDALPTDGMGRSLGREPAMAG